MPAPLPFTSARQDGDELLDLGIGTHEEMEASLRDLWRINRYLGGVAALVRPLFPRLRALARASARPITLVDVGAGSAEMALLIARWGRRNGVRLNVIAADLTARHLGIARCRLPARSGVQLVQADVMDLPFAPGEVDYYLSSLFMHHFAPEPLLSILSETYARARRGVIMSDVARGTLPLLGFYAVQPVFARSRLTRYDAVVSVRRAYTSHEIRALALQAGMHQPKMLYQFPFRFTLIADKAEAEQPE